MKRRLEVVKIFREKAPKITWCPNCNVPILRSDICDICGSKTITVRGIAYPRDVRYCYDNDKEIIVRSIQETYNLKNSEISKLIDRDEIVLLNKVQHVDSADQVIVRGRVIGIRYFDIEKRRWMFRPDYAGIKIMIDNKIGYYILLKRSKVVEGEYVDRSEILEGEIPNEDNIYIPFKLNEKDVYGILQVRGNKLKILKVIDKLTYYEVDRKSSNIYKTIKANISNIEKLEKNSINILRNAIDKYSEYLKIVTYSGGKDSTVITYLASMCGIDKVVFCDTTLEFPETYKTVDRMCKFVEIEHVEASREMFEKVFEILGPPARDFRWCTQICKLIPLKRFLEKYANNRKILSITGQRMFESPQRALAGYETEVYGPNPADIIVSPLYDWTALDIEMYIHYKNLPLNELYVQGFERVGCFICPTLRISEIEIIKKTHPELWRWWYDKLSRYRKRLKIPDKWLKYELWRWRFEIPGDLSNYLKRVGGYIDISEIPNPIVNTLKVYINEVNNEVSIDLVLVGIDKVDFNRLSSLIPIISREYYIKDNTMKVYTKTCVITITSSGRVNVWSRDLEVSKNIAETICKIVYMAHRCVKCFECVKACPVNILKVDEYPFIVDENRCIMCRECVKACILTKFIGITISKDLESKIV